MYDKDWPIRCEQFQLPPAKTVSPAEDRIGRAFNSIITAGTVISGSLVERSILGPNVRINSYSHISDSIIMNNTQIGRYSKIKRTIIDKGVAVPENEEIGYNLEKDKKRFKVTDSGIVVISKKYRF